jgi:uncharacterized protein
VRENRPHGSEGGESGSTGLPYPYNRVRSGIRHNSSSTQIAFGKLDRSLQYRLTLSGSSSCDSLFLSCLMSEAQPPSSESPCIGICKVNELPDGTSMCIGCFRKLQEIAAWSSLSPQQRIEVNRIVAERRQRFANS